MRYSFLARAIYSIRYLKGKAFQFIWLIRIIGARPHFSTIMQKKGPGPNNSEKQEMQRKEHKKKPHH